MKNLINLKSKSELSGFYMIYYGSTIYEKPGTFGISHLMEHLMCKNFEDLQNSFEEDGISWNAMTGSEYIIYYLTGLDKYVNKWKYTIYERMKNFQITQEMLDKEKMIVLEEYKDAFNTQAEAHFLNLNRKVFGEYDAIGQRESLEKLTLQDCKDFFDLQYKTPRIINVSKKNKFVLDGFVESNVVFPKNKLKLRTQEVTYEKSNDFKEKSSIVLFSPIVDEKDVAIVSFICSMFSNGLQSPFYQEIREKKGLVYYIRCYVAGLNLNGAVLISSETSNENADEFITTIKEIFDNKEKYLTQERFDRVKNFYEITYQKQEIERYKNIYKWVIPQNWNMEKLFKRKDFTLEKVLEMCEKYFKFDSYYKSIDKNEDFKN